MRRQFWCSPGELRRAAPVAWEISVCVQGREMGRVKKNCVLKGVGLAVIHSYLQTYNPEYN